MKSDGLLARSLSITNSLPSQPPFICIHGTLTRRAFVMHLLHFESHTHTYQYSRRRDKDYTPVCHRGQLHMYTCMVRGVLVPVCICLSLPHKPYAITKYKTPFFGGGASYDVWPKNTVKPRSAELWVWLRWSAESLPCDEWTDYLHSRSNTLGWAESRVICVSDNEAQQNVKRPRYTCAVPPLRTNWPCCCAKHDFKRKHKERNACNSV